MSLDAERGGLEPVEMLARIAQSLGRSGIDEVVGKLQERVVGGSDSGIIVTSEEGARPTYTMSVSPDLVDFMFEGRGPFVLPLGYLADMLID